MAVSNNESFSGSGSHSDPLANFAHLAHETLRDLVEEGAEEFAFGRGRRSMPRHEAEAALRQLDRLTGLPQPTSARAEEETVSFAEAANILFVKKEYLQKILERGDIPYFQHGDEKRILLEPLREYDRQRRQRQHEALNRMAKESQELGIYD